MISICIPVYNFNVTELVKSLQEEAETLNIPYEILISDNNSEEKFREENSLLSALPNVNYMQSEINLGRTGNRNLLFKTSKFSYILFMDCDSKVVKKDYLKNFLPYCIPGIVCSGGRAYLDEPVEDKFLLHDRVGKAKESFSAEQRSKNPNNSFMSCNFLIDKRIFDVVKFDERLQGYCNEDTLFGIELKKKGIIIQHIDNPLYHIGLEPADVFLSKIEDGLRNYHKINQLYNNDPVFIDSCKILKLQKYLKIFYLHKVCKSLFSTFRKKMYNHLTGANPHLSIYDLYKLGYLCYVEDAQLK